MQKYLLAIFLILISGCSQSIDVEIDHDSPINDAVVEDISKPKPLENPWPEEITRDRLIEAAKYESFSYFDKQDLNCDASYEVFMDETFHPKHVQQVNEFIEKTLSLFCEDIDLPIYVIGGKSDYVQTTVIGNSLPSDPFNGACGVPVGDVGSSNWMVACAWDGQLAWIGSTLGTVRNGELKTDTYRFSASIHEVVHLVQDQTFSVGKQGMPSRPHERFRPVWFIEGGADYLADSIAEYIGFQEYSWTTPTDRSGGRISLEDSSDLRVFETWASQSLGPVDYYAGQVASEYIVASVGFEAYLNILRNMEKNNGNFDLSFEQAIGITLEDFYSKFETMHKNLYDKKVIINN